MAKDLKESRMFIYGMYAKLIEAIKHFDHLQTTSRTMASTILLSTFVALGFLFSKKVGEFPVSRLIGMMVICFLSLCVITTICLLDLFFHERLLIANQIEALWLENRFSWLPKVHHRMLFGRAHQGARSRKVLFYVGCGASLFFLMGLGVALLVGDSIGVYLLVMAITLCVVMVYAWILRKITGRVEELIEKVYEAKRDII